MEKDLMLKEDLMKILGFKDTRSVAAWCKKNLVPLVKIGKRRYVSKSSVDSHISRLFKLNTNCVTEILPHELLKTNQSKQHERAKPNENSAAALTYMKKFKNK